MQLGKQVGVIVAGAGLNLRAAIEDAKRRGFVVMIRANHATLHEEKS